MTAGNPVSETVVSLISGGGIVGLIAFLSWVWKLASVLAELAGAIKGLRAVFTDHEQRLRTVERKRNDR